MEYATLYRRADLPPNVRLLVMMDLPRALRIIDEIREELRCKCAPDYTRNGNHGPDCRDYLVDDLDAVVEFMIKQEKQK